MISGEPCWASVSRCLNAITGSQQMWRGRSGPLGFSRETVSAFFSSADHELPLLPASLPYAVPATRPRLPRGLSEADHAKSRPRRWCGERWGRARPRLDWHGKLRDPAWEAASASLKGEDVSAAIAKTCLASLW